MTAKMHPFWWFKPPSCPSGEQIINGGFETGDFTGWTTNGWPSIDSADKHSGIYSCFMGNVGEGWAEQELSNSIPYICIDSFTLWFKAAISSGAYLTIVITYSDDTTTSFDVWSGANVSWHQVDIKSYLDTTKSVKKIKFTNKKDSTLYGQNVDDVSLIGSG